MEGAESENSATVCQHLKKVFSDEEISTVPDSCATKLSNYLSLLDAEKVDIRAQLEKYSVELGTVFVMLILLCYVDSLSVSLCHYVNAMNE